MAILYERSILALQRFGSHWTGGDTEEGRTGEGRVWLLHGNGYVDLTRLSQPGCLLSSGGRVHLYFEKLKDIWSGVILGKTSFCFDPHFPPLEDLPFKHQRNSFAPYPSFGTSTTPSSLPSYAAECIRLSVEKCGIIVGIPDIFANTWLTNNF